MKPGTFASTLFVLLVIAASAAAQEPVGDEPADPLELGLEEEVRVQFVLVDFLVLDRRDRTVPGLTIEDFELLVGGKPVEIATLDHDCPIGAAADPRSTSKPGAPAPTPTAEPRRIVIVIDYYHGGGKAEAFDLILEMLDQWPGGDDENMIASLGEVVRLETPFTKNVDELRWALRRMRNDRDLYGGNYGRLTERRFFHRVRVLFDLLERLPGRKSIVLFSGPFMNDGFAHDIDFRDLSALSTTARTSIYPVDAGGLRTGWTLYGSNLGGPLSLRRLANETGGRMTSDTNDIGLAYAKAHRDMGCSYTLGFYDKRPRPDDSRRLTIRIKGRDGLRVVYPEFYVVRSPEQKRKSLLRTAAMAPQMFESEEVSAELFVVAPKSGGGWRTVLGVELSLGPDVVVEEGEVWEVKGFLRKLNGTILRSFERQIPMPATDLASGVNPPVSLFQELSAPPGRYVASVVLSDPEGDVPLAATRQATLPEVPRGAPFLIGPVLGHRSEIDGDSAVKSDRTNPGFRPLLAAETARGKQLDALTVLCVRNSKQAGGTHTVARWITTPDGEDVRRFDDVAVQLSDQGGLQCHELIDPLGTEALEPGSYELGASAGNEEFLSETGAAEFTVRQDEKD